MLTVTTIDIWADSATDVRGFLIVSAGFAFVFFLWLCSATMTNAADPGKKLLSGAGLYLCYIVGFCAVSLLILPMKVADSVNDGVIALSDAPLCMAIMICVAFAVLNLVGLAITVGWKLKKTRKELSETDRMKLKDM